MFHNLLQFSISKSYRLLHCTIEINHLAFFFPENSWCSPHLLVGTRAHIIKRSSLHVQFCRGPSCTRETALFPSLDVFLLFARLFPDRPSPLFPVFSPFRELCMSSPSSTRRRRGKCDGQSGPART